MRTFFLLALFIGAIGKTSGAIPICCEETISLTAGPEIYWMRRWRDGGTKQTGRNDAVRITLERILSNSWYLAGEAFFSSGQLDGHTGSGRPLRSQINDHIFEGRLGYTFQNCFPGKSFITIFGGYGYFHETNRFRPPSPIPFTFTDTFNYLAVGFLSGVNFTPLLSMGINFEARFMLDGNSEVSDDPDFDNVDLMMNNEAHFRVEVPFTYLLHGNCNVLEISLIPFYEFRHFGGREGYPFDYIDTKFSLIGARLALDYRF